MIPEERFKAEIEKRKQIADQLAAAKAQVEALTQERDQFGAQVEGISAIRAELQAARSDLVSGTATSAAHISMLEAGVTKGSVRDFALFQHQQHVQSEGDRAQPWGDWWEANRAGMIADLAPQPTAATAQEVAAEPARPPQPMANNGAQPPPPAPQTYTPGMYANMSSTDWAAQKDQILSDLKGDGF